MTGPSVKILGIYARAVKPRLDELPENYVLKDLAPDQVMVRRRMAKDESASLIPEHGLVEEQSYFYHNDVNDHSALDLVQNEAFKEKEYPLEDYERVFDERAVLIQSIEHYKHLYEAPEMSQYFQSPQECLDSPTFGEQLIVEGLDHSDICIGDIFEVKDKTQASTLKLQVTSPRFPCAHLDKKNKSPFGSKGVRRYTLTHGLAGWFVRVLEAGDIHEGMELVRTAQPYPKWTLVNVSNALYGEGDRRNMLSCQPQWTRSKEELIELCAIPEFGWYEWKSYAQLLLDQMEDNEDEASAQTQLDAGFCGITSDSIFSSLPTMGDVEKNFSHTHALFAAALAFTGFHMCGMA